VHLKSFWIGIVNFQFVLHEQHAKIESCINDQRRNNHQNNYICILLDHSSYWDICIHYISSFLLNLFIRWHKKWQAIWLMKAGLLHRRVGENHNELVSKWFWHCNPVACKRSLFDGYVKILNTFFLSVKLMKHGSEYNWNCIVRTCVGGREKNPSFTSYWIEISK
jgi:hypothetical protein